MLFDASLTLCQMGSNTLSGLFPSFPPSPLPPSLCSLLLFPLRPPCRVFWMSAPVSLLRTPLTLVTLCSPPWKGPLSLLWVGATFPWFSVLFSLGLVPYLGAGEPVCQEPGEREKSKAKFFFFFLVFIPLFCSVDSLAGYRSLASGCFSPQSFGNLAPFSSNFHCCCWEVRCQSASCLTRGLLPHLKLVVFLFVLGVVLKCHKEVHLSFFLSPPISFFSLYLLRLFPWLYLCILLWNFISVIMFLFFKCFFILLWIASVLKFMEPHIFLWWMPTAVPRMSCGEAVSCGLWGWRFMKDAAAADPVWSVVLPGPQDLEGVAPQHPHCYPSSHQLMQFPFSA